MATLNTTEYKWVRVWSPGGVVINFQGQTGLSKPMALPVAIIKKYLEQKSIVEEIKDDETTLRLTLENYNTDNGGKAVEDTVIFPADIEKIHADAREAEQQARIDRIEKEYKEYFETNDAKDIVLLTIATTELVVNKGTIVEDVKLPMKATATLDDESEVEVKLTWDTSDFVANTVGEYELIGTPVLTQGIYNSGEETVTFTLKVIEPPAAEEPEGE
jgi:rhamnose utilization protein RhaD (predicted bifunctional aldolase and dehydrogenase)